MNFRHPLFNGHLTIRNDIMNCLIYGRVSTDKQEVENQIDQLKEYAVKQDWNIVEIITDD